MYYKTQQLFDFSLSDSRPSAVDWNKSYMHGCEVVVQEAPQQLAAMLDQFQPNDTGWYVLLIEVSGFNGHEWYSKTETLEALLSQLVPHQARTWMYLLGGNKLGVLVKVTSKGELVGFVQKLSSSLSADQTPPKTRMAEVPAQKQVVKDYLAAQQAALEKDLLHQQQALMDRKVSALNFELPEAIIAKRATRIRPLLLLVEDDPTTLQLLKHLVSQALTAEILVATNATEAALLYRRNAPDMVFLDIGLPEIDGLTLLKKVREADSDARVVILTANAYRSNLEEATRLGAKAFLAKPFTPAKIAEVVKKLLNRKGTL
jgi:two-component system, chemotaxis family, chemotaxis protein CheY